MSGGCFGGCFRGLGRRVRGAFRSIRERLALIRRNIHHVDGEPQGGTHNTVGCPDDGLPSSTKTVRDEPFFTEETTATSSVPGNKRTIQRIGKYRSVSQSPSISRQEDPSERTSLSQSPSGSSRQYSISFLDPIVSSTRTTPLHGNMVGSSSRSSPPSVSVQQVSSFSSMHSKAMMLTQQAVSHMKKTSAVNDKTRALIKKAYKCYKKDQLVSQYNRESANSMKSGTSRTYDEQLLSRSFRKVRRRYQASPMDRRLMRVGEEEGIRRDSQRVAMRLHLELRALWVFWPQALDRIKTIRGMHEWSLVYDMSYDSFSRPVDVSKMCVCSCVPNIMELFRTDHKDQTRIIIHTV
uniref:Uncharacterized protein n=1 Tax=Timema shepardi TaxID=629360 RepID=A0A7R9G4Y6_TIMSH|nr:unnamed protein product [Timema shepardi]